MDAPLESPAEEIARLRRCLDDLAGIMSLPALRMGEPSQIVGTLLDSLLAMLQVTFVFIRFADPESGRSLEMVRVAEPLSGTASGRELGAALDRALGNAPPAWPQSARVVLGGIDLAVACVRLGLRGEIGVIAAGSRAPDFPGQAERILLDVAANQAAIGLQHARLVSEDTRRAHDSERESRLLLDSIPGLVGLLTATGDVEVVNRPLLEYFGQTLEELRQWGTNGTVHSEDLPHVVEIFSRSMASGTPYEILQRFRRADGVYRWFQNSGFPLRDPSGRIARWCVLLTDIDERKRAEDALRRSEAFLLEGQQLARLGSFSWRVATDEITWSEQLYRIFGFEPGSPVTLQVIATRVHPEDIGLLDEMVARARLAVSDFEYEHRLLMPGGSVKHVQLIAHGTRDEQGRMEYIGAVQDVTQRRTSEEALGQARAELTHVARVMSLGTLTASIAHEVNQPLSGIITNASTCLRMLAADPPDVEGARETARRTIRDGNRASDVIARLRALFSKKAFALERLDLNEVTREVIALSLRDLQRNGVIVRSELADRLPSITGDRVQLQQVILNLLRNASDAMVGIHDRPRHLRIRTDCQDGERVRLTVRDAGVGVDPLSMDKLFHPFYTTKNGGMGIGLSISRSIVERHHGRLWAEPNAGPGATFSLSIPRAPESAADAAAPHTRT